MAEDKTRRAFVKGAAQVAVTAPAVAVLLKSGTSRAAGVVVGYGPGDDGSILTADDQFLDDTILVGADDSVGGVGDN